MARTRPLSAAIMVALSAAILVSLPRPKSAGTDEERTEVEGLAFGSVKAPAGFSAMLTFSRDASELRAWNSFGSEVLAVACDGTTYWFWMRSYDPHAYYFCPASETGEVGLNPLFSTTLLRLASGAEFAWRDHPDDGEMEFKDGDHSASVRFSGGKAVLIVYSIGGFEEASVRITEHQKVAGRWLSRRIVASAEGLDEVELDIGEAEVNPPRRPDAGVPRGIKGRRLEVRR